MRYLSLMLLFLLIVGCSRAKPDSVGTTEKTPVSNQVEKEATPVLEPATPAAKTTEPATSNTQSTELVTTAPEGSAQAAFQQVLISFQQGRFDRVFEFLPPSHQSDVEGLVHLFAEKMDSELWSKTFDCLTRLAGVMKSKKELILNHDLFRRLSQTDAIRANWDSITSGLNDLATGELASIEKLKTSDLRAIVSAGNQLARGIPLPKFGDVTVDTVSSNDQSATLSYRDSTDPEPKQVEFVKIDGKWMPKSLAEGWARGIDNAKTQLRRLPDQIAAIKPILSPLLDSLNESLDKMQRSSNSEEFGLAFQPFGFSVMTGFQFLADALQQAESLPRKPLRIEVNRELNDEQQTELKNAVLTSLDGAQVDYEISASDGKTRLRFSSIPDADALVKVLQQHFASANVRLNSEAQSILVELK